MADGTEVGRRLSAALKAVMKERDVSISDLHKRTGISRETIYRILRQESLPTTDVLLRIAAELRVSPGALLDNARDRLRLGDKATAVEDRTMLRALEQINARLASIETTLKKRE